MSYSNEHIYKQDAINNYYWLITGTVKNYNIDTCNVTHKRVLITLYWYFVKFRVDFSKNNTPTLFQLFKKKKLKKFSKNT